MLRKDNVKKQLENFLGQGSEVNLYFVSSNSVDVLAVSDKFLKLSKNSRDEMIKKWFDDNFPKIQPLLQSLYTKEEATALNIEVKEFDRLEKPSSWFDLINLGNNDAYVSRNHSNSARTIAFYSFKGGVGRTTALIHVAWELASRGKKIVVVDLDLEAPSIHQAFGNYIAPKTGLVDFLYQKAIIGKQEKSHIQITDIIGEVTVLSNVQ